MTHDPKITFKVNAYLEDVSQPIDQNRVNSSYGVDWFHLVAVGDSAMEVLRTFILW